VTATPLPAVVNLTAYQGDTWSQTFRFKQDTVPLNLTGATVAAWAKPYSGPVVILTATITNAVGGEVQLSATAPLPTGGYQYDVEVTKASVVTTWVRGTLTVNADVTNHV
jgi:hypothetical protein